jgi:hypothetical protein
MRYPLAHSCNVDRLPLALLTTSVLCALAALAADWWREAQ